MTWRCICWVMTWAGSRAGGTASPIRASARGIDITTLPGLIAAIDRQNALWVEGTRRISPRLLIAFLDLTGELTEDYFRGLDLTALGRPVDWVGPEPAPVWLDLAREYTERWVHQQHIRDAIGRPGLKERRWFAPVLATFVRGLPRALGDAPAPEGATVRLIITGEAGGEWVARKEGAAWTLGTAPGSQPMQRSRSIRRPPGGSSPRASQRKRRGENARIEGDPALAARVFDTVSILA